MDLSANGVRVNDELCFVISSQDLKTTIESFEATTHSKFSVYKVSKFFGCDEGRDVVEKGKMHWDENENYEVEQIVDRCVDDGKEYYLIKWKGWSRAYNSWEPRDKLNCENLLEEFRILNDPKLKKNKYLKRRASLDEGSKKSSRSKQLSELWEKIHSTGMQEKLSPLELLSASSPKKVKGLLSLQSKAKHTGKLRFRPASNYQNKKTKRYRDKAAEVRKALSEWETKLNAVCTDPAPIVVENSVDLEGPPDNFEYINDYRPGEGIEIPQEPLVGCDCKTCNGTGRCCPHNSGAEFAYYKCKRVKVPQGTPIYECNKRCKCGSGCANRVVQEGRKCKLSIFRTHNGRGWGVKTLQKMKKGTFVMEYLGEALTDYGIVLLLGDDFSLKVLINRGLLYFERGDYTNALYDFKMAAKLNPWNYHIHHSLGLCYHKINQLQESVVAFTRSLVENPFFLEALVARGNVYMDYGHEEGLKQARSDYQRVLMLNPNYLSARVNLAYSLQMRGHLMQAWKQFTAGIAINSSYRPALEGRAIVNLQMSDTFAAYQDISGAINVAPTAELYTNRGVINQFMKDGVNAMKDYHLALKKDPTYSLAYFNAANIHFHTRHFKQALDYYSKAIQYNSRDESAYLNRAITKVMLRDSTSALEDFKLAVKLSPYSAHIYFNRGNLYASMQKYDKAETDYNKALSLKPDDPLVLKRRADVKGKLGKKVEAIEDYRRAVLLQSQAELN